MGLLYNLSIRLYYFFILIASAFNSKAKLWINGRKNIFDRLSGLQVPGFKLIWFHCASLGEFEQARPIIEKFKVQSSTFKILVTFFSPSGYEVRKNYAGVDRVYYLPLDTPANAKKFIEAVKPAAAFFIKYEFWFNHLSELKKKNIPAFLVSGVFRKDQHFFQWYGGWFRGKLGCFTHFFLQDEPSAKLLHSIGFTNTTVSGDTRFDRVAANAEQARENDIVRQFKGDKKLFVVGSSWEEDEKIVSGLPFTAGLAGRQVSGWKIIIAPHEVNEARIKRVIDLFGGVRYSELLPEANGPQPDVLIIDNIGMLASLYKYADIAYVGGAFGKGLHNILEPAAFGVPVLFGPNIQKYPEAKSMVEKGGGFSTGNAEEFGRVFNMLASDPDVRKIAGMANQMFIRDNKGATEKVMKFISAAI